MYNVLGYKTKHKAFQRAEIMKKMYGYMPSVFEETNPITKKRRFVVVKPTGLKRI